jgi:hypothetical protein
MKPYTTMRLIEFPDVADIKLEARQSRCGRTDEHGYCRRPSVKHSTRRYLKRADRARRNREDFGQNRAE